MGGGAESAWHLRPTPAELEREWIDAGFWDDETLGQLLDRELVRGAALGFHVHSSTRPWSGTYRDITERARRLAAGLQRRGIGPGDAVAFQLPNCMEAAVTFYAACFLGAAVVPIVHFYGPKEVGYILRRTGVRALVTIDRFGPIDHLAALDRLGPDLATVELISVVGSPEGRDDVIPFDDLLAGEPLAEPMAADPSAPALIAYTSGTTADPKGVVHSHRTAGAEARQLSALQPADAPPNLVGAPVGHAMGMLAALLLPVLQQRPIHVIDVWDPARVLQVMAEHQVNAGSGATFFLMSLLDHPDCGPEHRALMGKVGLGGAAVPAAVADRATAAGISIVRMYGSTEHPSITGGTHADPLEKRSHTDGRALDGVHLRLVDDDNVEVSSGEPGEIVSRGPDCFVGYTDPEQTALAFDDEGWFHTGDIGVLDDDGYLRITDRKKDVIIRGGENVSAVEVEEVVAAIPGVIEVAVVAGPDARMGERVCALVRIDPSAERPTLGSVRAATEAAGLARPKWPEEVRVVDDFPRTPTGKIQKVVLRAQLRDEAVGRA
jgi:acyl-CoA synthetase (AMP-forming)/AMP-acid ligase II